MEENNKTPVVQIIEQLEEKVKQNTVTVEDFNTVFNELQEARLKIQRLLEYKTIDSSDKKYQDLYRKVSQENFSDLVDKLNASGYALSKNKELADVFDKNGYRIMEQVRLGKKDDVFHSLLRIFMSSNIPFPKYLLTAFKQNNTEMFKVLIYSFFSGIIKVKKDNDNN
jgi:stage III sporulation protein SpoIIIAA